VPGADADANAGDRSYLVLGKPHVIMNDTRLRGLAVAGSVTARRKSPHNHAQTTPIRGLDCKSAADVAANLADTLTELRRLERSLNRRIRRDRFTTGASST
jgi:hypothetical protein